MPPGGYKRDCAVEVAAGRQLAEWRDSTHPRWEAGVRPYQSGDLQSEERWQR